MTELKRKQQLFVDEYLVDMNATKAAIRAGYSEKTAYSIGQENLNKPEIAAAIEKAFAERSKRTKIDADWLLNRLAEEADADVAEMFDEAGDLLPVRSWPKILRKGLVTGIDVSSGNDGTRITKIKLADRNAKLKMIGDHIGVAAFKQHVTNTLQGPGGGPIQTQAVDATKLSDSALAEILAAKTQE